MGIFHITEEILLAAAEQPADPARRQTVSQVQEELQKLNLQAFLDQLKAWMPGLLNLGYRLLAAALLLFIGGRLIRVLRRFLKKTFERMDLDLSLSRFLVSVTDAAAYALLIFIAAEKVGIPSASIIALLGSAGLAIGLAIQGSLANFAGGILILVMRPFRVGDYISGGGVEGVVDNIGLVYTTLVTYDNQCITIPNGDLSNTVVTNVTAQEKRRVDISVGIGYGSDLKKAKEIMASLFQNHPLVLWEEDIVVFVSELADSAVIIGARGWTETSHYWQVKWDITEQVKLAFDEAGIEIPFRQVDVNIKRD